MENNIAKAQKQHNDEIMNVIKTIKKPTPNDLIIIGGDFNEASHLDWNTNIPLNNNRFKTIKRNVYNNFFKTTRLMENDFIDSWREINKPDINKYTYSKVKNNCGNTYYYDKNNRHRSKEEEDININDRIDFIYYNNNNKGYKCIESKIRELESKSEEWPSDHYYVVSTLQLNNK